MKKIILMILSLTMALGGVAAVSASAAVPEEGYKFIDIAYNGSGTYVAMAKDSNLAYAKLYYSNDNGLTWKLCSNQPQGVAYGTEIAANKNSQQQLVWWGNKKLFVVKGSGNSNSGGNNTYTSADGITWSTNAAVNWSSAAMMTVSGDYLVLGANQKARAIGDAASSSITTDIQAITTNTGYYVKTLAAKPVDSEGNVTVFFNGCNYAYDFKFSTASSSYPWTLVHFNSGNTVMYPYDMIYAAGADRFLSVDGSEKLLAATDSQHVSKYTIKDGVNVTGVNASDKYIAVGMSDGTMYYTANTAITENTEWTEIKPLPGASAGTEPIKNIEFSDDSNFIALGETQIYKASIDGYCNIDEYGSLPEITVPKVSDVFTEGDGCYAKTAVFEVKPNGKSIGGVKVKVNGQEQTKSWGADIESPVKFGIILVSDDIDKINAAAVSAELVTE